MNILDMLKNAGKKTVSGVKNFLSTTPTTLNEQGETVPAEGAQPRLDVGGKIAPLVMAAFALKNPETGAPMLNSYTVSRQNQLEQQKEDAWKQWQVKANQKRQAIEDERYNTEHPAYAVPTTADLAKNSPVDYGQYVQNPMTTGINLGGGFKPEDKLQNQINNLGQLSDQNNPEMWVAGGTKPQGMTEEGTVDLLDRPQVKNPDRSISTTYSRTFDQDGKAVLVPGVRHGLDRVMTPEETLNYYKQTGQHFGVFDSEKNADDYAEKLHNQQEDLYANKKPTIPFLNFGQKTQPQQAPSLSPEAPVAQLRQPSRLDQFAGQNLPLNEALRLQGLDEQDREKAKGEREKMATREAKINDLKYYRDLLPEDDSTRKIIDAAIKNPDAYNLDFAIDAYQKASAPKQQPINWEGINISKEWKTTFKLNPKMATPENLVKAIADIKDPTEQATALVKLKGMGLTNEKLEAQIREIIARTEKIGREGTNKKETAAEKAVRLNNIIATAGQYRNYTDYVADLKRNSKAFISDFGSAAYQKAIKDANGLPVWQKVVGTDTVTGKKKESYGQGIAFVPGQGSPMARYFPNYVTKEQVKTTVQQPAKTKTLKPTDNLAGPVATAIKKALESDEPNAITKITNLYGYSEKDQLAWYKQKYGNKH